jgi:hypothetical protein
MDEAPAPAPTAAEGVDSEVRPRRRAVRRPRPEEPENGGDANEAIGNKAETPAE